MTNTTHTAAQIERFRTATIAKAEQLLGRFPQYKGSWDGWRAVRMTRTIKTKLGPAFQVNEWTIATVDAGWPEAGIGPRVLAFSLSNVINTEVGDDAVEWLDGQGRPAPTSRILAAK